MSNVSKDIKPQKFAVKYVEKLSKTVIVEATSFDEAKDKARTAYGNFEFELDPSSDFEDGSFEESETFGRNPIDETDSRIDLFTVLNKED